METKLFVKFTFLSKVISFRTISVPSGGPTYMIYANGFIPHMGFK